MSAYSAILFRSSSHSLWAARVLKKEGIERNMIPIPRSVSPDCGYCIRIPSGVAGKADEALARAGIEFSIVDLGEPAFAAGAEAWR
jgi:hypothetical protein